MSATATIAEVISENFMNIFYAIVIVLIVYVVGKVIIVKEKEKTKLKGADLRLKAKKMELFEKERHIKNLKEASMVLKDDEKSRVDEIERDKAILSRRSLALMNEIEERMQRLERGADNAKLLKTLRDIKGAERELFGKEGGNR